jgi:L-amino acid N-acyltransferase YncA
VDGDLPEITAIYNEVLMTSTAIYRDEPATVAERLAWWQARVQQDYPTLVACDDAAGTDRAVIGFASFGDFR